jgi:hypothetical protein
MSIFDSPRFLRNVLIADAVSCLATGAVQALFTNSLAELFSLPAVLLAATGWFLLAYAALVSVTAMRDPLSRPLVWLLVAGNLSWGTACVLLLAGRWLAPTPWGAAWILAQAATVAVLAMLQWTGLRRGGDTPGWA